MLLRILKWFSTGLGILCLLGAGALLLRTEPWGPLPGGRLAGEEATRPAAGWGFTREHQMVALEVRPQAPYSVQVSCFVHQEDLYVLAGTGSGSRWGRMLLEDPAVRIRIGSRVYPGTARRVENEKLEEELMEAWLDKYREMPHAFSAEQLEAMWFFRIASD